MRDYHLNVFSDRFEPGASLPRPLAALPRAIYVASGTVAVNSHDLAASLSANSAIFTTSEVNMIAGGENAGILRWEVATQPAPSGASAHGGGVETKLVRSDALALPADQGAGWLLRCDRVDFPARGKAYLHTHQGPGTRCLLFGAFEVETGGEKHNIGPGEAWFETGPDPVYAQAGDEPACFVRVMILPGTLRGKSSIEYLNPEDADKPKSQTYQVFLDQPVDLR